LKGAPRDIGYQYGCLLASEIDDAQKALRDELKQTTGKDWSYFRDTSKKLFWDKVDPEYQQEIEGQAEGLRSKNLPYDQWDVLAFNGYIEIGQYYLPWSNGHPDHLESCSAFIATGSETSDGRIVVAQNFWWDWQMGERFDVVLDIEPKHGHRIVMDTLPGFIHSGTDFALNDSGLIVTETTLPPLLDFDPQGTPEFVRMRKAVQYADSINGFAEIMEGGNNGGYANSWLIGDTKTNEIAKLELGLKNVTLQITRDGYYCGSNFPESPKLIKEETRGWSDDPATNGCEARRARWTKLLDQNKGRVDAEMSKGFLADIIDPNTGASGASDFTLCGRSAMDGANNAKVVTSELASKLTFWGRMGAPDGQLVSFGSGRSPFLHDLQPHPWVQLARKPSDR
jgi:hypothetical protein